MFGPQGAESLFLQSPTGAREGYEASFIAGEAVVNDDLGQFADLDYRVRHGGCPVARGAVGANRIKIENLDVSNAERVVSPPQPLV